MNLGLFVVVYVLSLIWGVEDGHVPTFWPPLYILPVPKYDGIGSKIHGR